MSNIHIKLYTMLLISIFVIYFIYSGGIYYYKTSKEDEKINDATKIIKENDIKYKILEIDLKKIKKEKREYILKYPKKEEIYAKIEKFKKNINESSLFSIAKVSKKQICLNKYIFTFHVNKNQKFSKSSEVALKKILSLLGKLQKKDNPYVVTYIYKGKK